MTGRTVLAGGMDWTMVVSPLTAMLVPFAFVDFCWKRSVRSPIASAAVMTCVVATSPGMSTQVSPCESQRRH
jgi:hypothetical protein